MMMVVKRIGQRGVWRLVAATACIIASAPRPGAGAEAGAATARPREAAEAFAPPSALAATLTADGHVALRWENRARESGGCFVECRIGADEEFFLLDAVWADRTSFVHPDVARDTQFTYRLQPFFGRPSEAVRVVSGPAPAEPADALAQAEGPLPPPLKPPNASADETAAMRHSLRLPETLPHAAPGRLDVKLSGPLSVELRWEDRAADEDGYLVEWRPAGEPGFIICALLPPDADSFRKVALPPGTRCEFRVRAYVRGAPSASASVRTPRASQE